MTSQTSANLKTSYLNLTDNSLVASSPSQSNRVTSSSFENSTNQINETTTHIREISGTPSSSATSSSSSSSTQQPHVSTTVSSHNSEHSSSQLKLYKPNPSLPFIFLSVSATLSNSQFLALITRTFVQLHYTQILSTKDKHQETYISVYERQYKSCIKALLKKCTNKYTVKQFHITLFLNKNPTSNDKYERRIVIRSVKGKERSMEKKIILFIKHIIPFVTSVRVLKQSKTFTTYSLNSYINQCMNEQKRNLYRYKSLPYNEDYSIDFHSGSSSNTNSSNSNAYSCNYDPLISDNTLIEISNNEACKVYDIYKILSRDDYELGKSVGDFVSQFKAKYADVQESALKYKTKTIMAEIVKVIDECVDTFNTVFNNTNNSGSGNTSINTTNTGADAYCNIAHTKVEFIRQACEQFIFNKISFILSDIYRERHKQDNELFMSSIRRIRSENDVDSIFKHLEIKEKFKTDDKPIPYKISVDLINKIEYEISPKKKFEYLIKSNLEIRNSIFDFTKGKSELESMDDELPLIIYLATQVNVSNLPAELSLIDEYLQCSIKDDFVQNKMITNLQSAIVYISKTWFN